MSADIAAAIRAIDAAEETRHFAILDARKMLDGDSVDWDDVLSAKWRRGFLAGHASRQPELDALTRERDELRAELASNSVTHLAQESQMQDTIADLRAELATRTSECNALRAHTQQMSEDALKRLQPLVREKVFEKVSNAHADWTADVDDESPGLLSRITDAVLSFGVPSGEGLRALDAESAANEIYALVENAVPSYWTGATRESLRNQIIAKLRKFGTPAPTAAGCVESLCAMGWRQVSAIDDADGGVTVYSTDAETCDWAKMNGRPVVRVLIAPTPEGA